MTYRWFCLNETDPQKRACRNLQLGTNSTAKVGAGNLTVGYFKFTLEVSLNRRASNDTVTIEVTSSSSPEVQVSFINKKTKYNVGEYVQLSGSWASNASVSSSAWSQSDSNAQIPAALLGVDPSGNARPQATINVRELTA